MNGSRKSKMGAATPGNGGPELRWVAPTELSGSKLNPRKRFVQGRLVEMADSIGEHGVQVPMKARVLEDGSLELIWGERRWRGSMLVYQGYEDAEGVVHAARPDLRVPVLVEVLTDAEVFELMMLENLQREDLSPREEAEGYARMMEEWGLSQAEVAHRLGVGHQRVSERVRLLDLPEVYLNRVDGGELPMYVALEALRVPAEWAGGTARVEALRLAEEAGSAVRARELVEGRFLRPARECGLWESEGTLAELARDFGAGVERLPYRLCRELWPAGVTALTPVTAGEYVLAHEVPTAPVVHFATPLSWREMAELWGAPLYVGCDGMMNRVLLARRDLVAQAARTRHTMEVEVVERDGVCWWRGDVTSTMVMGVGDRVALLRLSGKGDLPLGYVAGRIYGVVEVEWGDEGEVYVALGDGPGGSRLSLSGAGGARVGLLDLSRCPFLPLEGRISTEALRQEAAEREGEAAAAAAARRAKVVDLVGRAEMGIRGSLPSPAGDLLWAKATQFLAIAGAVGLSGAEHPGHVLLATLERGEDEGETFSAWEGWGTRQGAESFAVCAWLLYFLSEYEGKDVEAAPQWREVRGAYGV